jgi:hypothetical protein
MKPQFFGDSYDIVKQSFLRWLAATGPWSTHPMFTEPVSSEQADRFGRLLGTRILSREVLTSVVDRNAYLAPARDCRDHVFLDPDTGIRLQPTRRKKAPQYIFGPELVAIANARPGRLTLVFDQSLARGAERQQLQDKLSNLAAEGVHGVAYVSHACFVLVGMDHSAVAAAFESLKRESGLPGSRFLAGAL